MLTLLTVRVRASPGDRDSGLFLVGDLPQLSEWGALTPLPLSYVDGAFTTTIALPAHTELEYKYVEAYNGMIVTWEGPPFLNRSLKTGKEGTAMDVDDGDFGSDQHAAVRVVDQERPGVGDDRQLSSDSIGESIDSTFGECSGHSHAHGVCGVEAETADINGADIDTLECVRRDIVALSISRSEPKLTLELGSDYGNAPTNSEEQKIVTRPVSCFVSDASEGSSTFSEDNGPVSVASGAFEPDISHPEQPQRAGQKGSAFERPVRSIVAGFRTLFTRKRSKTSSPPQRKRVSLLHTIMLLQAMT